MLIEPKNSAPTTSGDRMDRFIMVWRAKALLFLGMREAAKGVFLEMAKRWPDDVLALNSLAYDAIQSRHPAIALDYYARVLKLQGQRVAKFVDEKDHHDPSKTVHRFDGFEQVAPGRLDEHGYDQAEAVRSLLQAAGLHNVQSRCDLAGIERCSGGHLLAI